MKEPMNPTAFVSLFSSKSTDSASDFELTSSDKSRFLLLDD
jgi:hypothetical protein